MQEDVTVKITLHPDEYRMMTSQNLGIFNRKLNVWHIYQENAM